MFNVKSLLSGRNLANARISQIPSHKESLLVDVKMEKLELSLTNLDVAHIEEMASLQDVSCQFYLLAAGLTMSAPRHLTESLGRYLGSQGASCRSGPGCSKASTAENGFPEHHCTGRM